MSQVLLSGNPHYSLMKKVKRFLYACNNVNNFTFKHIDKKGYTPIIYINGNRIIGLYNLQKLLGKLPKKSLKKLYPLYPKEWTKLLKHSIKLRDNFTCQLCGLIQQGNSFRDSFPVHHIDYNKVNCNSDNLITLCHKCHIKTNTHRKHWIDYFNT